MRIMKNFSRVLAGGLLKIELRTEDFENPSLGLISRELNSLIYQRRRKSEQWRRASGIILRSRTFVYPTKKDGKRFVFSYGSHNSVTLCRNLTNARKKANLWTRREFLVLKSQVRR